MDLYSKHKLNPNMKLGSQIATHITRRQFLQVVGTTTLGALTTAIPILTVVSNIQWREPTPDEINKALEVAQQSSLFQEIISLLQNYELSFKIDTKAEIHRNISGIQAFLGRPILLPGICSWFINS